MNLVFGVPALAGPGRLKAVLRTDGTTQTGPWSQCTVASPRGLSMNPGVVRPTLELARLAGWKTGATKPHYW